MEEGNNDIPSDTNIDHSRPALSESVPNVTSGSDPLPNQKKSAESEAKDGRISQACRDRDLNALRDLAAGEGGLISDGHRHIACKYLAIHSPGILC